jgi:hypothetical protein
MPFTPFRIFDRVAAAALGVGDLDLLLQLADLLEQTALPARLVDRVLGQIDALLQQVAVAAARRHQHERADHDPLVEIHVAEQAHFIPPNGGITSRSSILTL